MDEIELLESQVKEVKKQISLLKRQKKRKRKNEILDNEIRKFRKPVENGEMFLKDVATQVCCGVKKVQKLAKIEKWDKRNNIKRNIQNLRIHNKKFEFDPLEYAKKIQQQVEEQGMSVKATICKRCGNKIFALSAFKHSCYKKK